MRNFWVEIGVDGQRPFAFGPKSSEDGFRLSIRMKSEDNKSEMAALIIGKVEDDGSLSVTLAPSSDIQLGANSLALKDNPLGPGFVVTNKEEER